MTWTNAFGRGSKVPLYMIVDALALTKISPNWLTFIGLVINIIAAIFFGAARVDNHVRMFFYGGLVIIGAGIFDMVDGRVARATTQSARRRALERMALRASAAGARVPTAATPRRSLRAAAVSARSPNLQPQIELLRAYATREGLARLAIGMEEGQASRGNENREVQAVACGSTASSRRKRWWWPRRFS